jgi:hypothetical protein
MVLVVAQLGSVVVTYDFSCGKIQGKAGSSVDGRGEISHASSLLDCWASAVVFGSDFCRGQAVHWSDSEEAGMWDNCSGQLGGTLFQIESGQLGKEMA